MNKLMILFSLFIICLSSCDGRDRMHQTNEDVLKENKLLDSFSEKVNYIPEVYSEMITDTIMSDGFEIKIKTYTDMDNNSLEVYKKNEIIHKNYYRTIESRIQVKRDGKNIFDKVLRKSDFKDVTNSDNIEFFNDLTFRGVWLNQERSYDNSNQLVLTALLTESKEVPNADSYLEYELIISSDNKYEIKQKI